MTHFRIRRATRVGYFDVEKYGWDTTAGLPEWQPCNARFESLERAIAYAENRQLAETDEKGEVVWQR